MLCIKIIAKGAVIIMRKFRKRLLSLMLSTAMVIVLFVGATPIEAYAAEGASLVASVDVQVDWSKVPTLTEGTRTVPSISGIPGTCTADGAEAIGAAWAVKIDESHKITQADSYYNQIMAMESIMDAYGDTVTGAEFIESYNQELDQIINVFNGMVPITTLVLNPCYEINENDTYAMYIMVIAEDGKNFGGSVGQPYTGTLTSNLDIVCQFVDGSEADGLVVFFELGTLAEMEEEKNEAGGELNMWKFYNLLTGANKSSYIDSFLDRSLNATEMATGINMALHGDEKYKWFID